jgi:hypothetical protein
MSRGIQGVANPEQLLILIGLALDQGGITLEDANIQMRYVPTSGLGKQYLDFACQIGLFYEIGSASNLEFYLPTRYGRYLYSCWLRNPKKAVAEMLGAIPQFRFHVELMLVDLILTGITRNTNMSYEITTISQRLPWFLERMAWIQDQIGWRDASTFKINQLASLKSSLQHLAMDGWKTYGRVWGHWDDILGFGSKHYLSDMSKIEIIRGYLAATHKQPLHVMGKHLNDETLITLILLMIAKTQHSALAIKYCSNQIETLLSLGIDIRQSDENAYLISAVELTLPYHDPPYQVVFGAFNNAKVDSLLAQIYKIFTHSLKSEIVTINLNDLFQHIRSDLLDSGLFTFSPFADIDDINTPGVLQLWQPPILSSHKDYDFFGHLYILGNSRGRVELPLGEVFLNQQALEYQGDVHYHLRHTPHFALLLLLLYDVGGAAEYLCLKDETWHFNQIELISALDKMLLNFGFLVWSEGYCSDFEKRRLLGRELVNLACWLGVAQVDGARLIEKGDGTQASDYYYKAVNVINQINRMDLSHE